MSFLPVWTRIKEGKEMYTREFALIFNLAPRIGYQIKSIGCIDDFLIRLMISVKVDSEE